MPTLSFCVKVIDLRPQKQNTDTEIQPQHQKNNGCQAPIHVGIVAEIIKINRKNKGKPNPAQGGKYSAGNLEPQGLLFIWNYSVESGEDDGQDGEGQQGAEADNVQSDIS